MTREIAEWLLYNKASLIEDMDKVVSLEYPTYIEDQVTSALKVLALSYKGESFTTEQILIAFEEPEIKEIIGKHFIREWYYE